MTGDDMIDRLITRFFSGEALPEEAMMLEDWIKMSPANKAYFDEYSRIFETTGYVVPDDKEKAWKITSDAIRKEETRRRPGVLKWRITGIAASFILVVAIGLLINKDNRKAAGAIVHTADAMARKIVLKDSSEIIVYPHSSISIGREYGVRNRRITLNGSATFSVSHNPSLELIVDVNSFHIKDLGTRFSVVASPQSDTISISVVEGEIAVYDDFGSSENVSAGEHLVYTRSNRKIAVFPAKRDPVIARPPQNVKTIEPKRPHPGKMTRPAIVPDSAGKQPDQLTAIMPDTARGDNGRTFRDSTPSQRIVTDLVRDGLIIRGHPLRFTLSDTVFILNGKRQPDAIHLRYREKYGGIKASTAPWSWTHGDKGTP